MDKFARILYRIKKCMIGIFIILFGGFVVLFGVQNNVFVPVGIVGVVTAVIGLIVLIVTIKNINKDKKIDKDIEEGKFDNSVVNDNTLQVIEMEHGDEVQEYTFKQDAFMKFYRFIDKDGNVAYEAVRTKFTLFNSTYDFINHLNNTKVSHKVGATTTLRDGNMVERNYYKIDNEIIWDYLRKNGIKINLSFMKISVEYKGKEISSWSMKPVAACTFKIACAPKHLPIVFLAMFTAARCPLSIANF